MAELKHFVLIGLGTFGTALATKLKSNGCRVTGIDSRSEQVESLKNVLFEALIGDATDRASLEPLVLSRATGVVISLGEDITHSLLATLHARELGAKHIMVKGVTSEHGRILKLLGVERVIYPEIEIANQFADRLTWPNIIDYLPIDSDHSFVEIAVPDSLAGKTLIEVDFRRKFGIWIVGVKDALTGKLDMFPDPNFRFSGDQILLVVCKEVDIARLRKSL